jgi:hypothetical protein
VDAGNSGALRTGGAINRTLRIWGRIKVAGGVDAEPMRRLAFPGGRERVGPGTASSRSRTRSLEAVPCSGGGRWQLGRVAHRRCDKSHPTDLGGHQSSGGVDAGPMRRLAFPGGRERVGPGTASSRSRTRSLEAVPCSGCGRWQLGSVAHRRCDESHPTELGGHQSSGGVDAGPVDTTGGPGIGEGFCTRTGWCWES